MAEKMLPPQGLTPRPKRFGLYLPFGILLGIMALWTGFWFFSANAAGKIADNFIAREGERGRDWVCPERAVGGYPFRIEISCVKPQLILKSAQGLRHQGSLGALSLHARILSPGHFIAVLSPPFLAKNDDAGDVELTWKSARASVRAGLQSISEASVEFVDPALSAGQGERRDIAALAKSFEVHLRHSPGETPGTDLVARMQDLTFAPLDQLIGTKDPIRMEVQATAPGFIPDPKRRFQDVLEEWRRGGHKARVVVLKATKGQANLDLSGVMGLDELHRLEGNLQGRAKGLDALTSGFARRGGLDLGGVLGKLGGGQGLPVALVFENGRLRFGPFPLANLAPLY
ncbi:MAG: hypothetical protein FD175_2365 [Beijerinckiaceae bacterium]|nr:MAG: hypothetical protein FD175_2365 [Beijerinckiaceae bacterium]